MNRILFLLGLVLYLNSNVYALELENLCPNDRFYYKQGELINSVLRIKINATVPAISTFMLDEELNYDKYFFNKTDSDKLNDLRDEYNTLMMKIFSEAYLNKLVQNFENDKLKIETIKNQTNELREHAQPFFKSYLDKFQFIYKKGAVLIDLLMVYKGNFLHPSIYTLGSFKTLISGLIINENNETFSFKNDPITRFYKLPIEQFERFYFLSASKNFYDFKSNGIVEFSINLPFLSSNWSQNSPCISSNRLPPFFSKKMSH